jgi:hypothetical protein
MKRPSRTAVVLVGAFVAFIVVEVIVWWPDASKKRSEDPQRREPPPQLAATLEPPSPVVPSASSPPSAPPPRPGRTIPQLRADESDEVRRLEGCSDKHCGDPCIFRCDLNDGRCVDGKRPGACTLEGVCSTTLPAVCH